MPVKYIKPRPKSNGVKADWKVAKQIKELVKQYALYTGYSEVEIVNTFLIELRNDPEFKAWLDGQRNNKRALEYIYAEAAVGDEFIDENQTFKPTP